MQALTLERWVLDPGSDTADPSSDGDKDLVPYAFTWTDTGDPAEMQPYAFEWPGGDAETAGVDAKSIAAGAGTGAALGGAIGTVFPGIGNAVGAGIGGAIGAIGGFFSGLFGGGKKRRKPRKKPTPSWLVPILEDARRALMDVPPNPAKSLDAVLVLSGQMTREAYQRARREGKLPSQRYDRNRSAVVKKAARMHKQHGPRIAAKLAGLRPGEQALVSAAMPLQQGTEVLSALRAIRTRVEAASRPQRPAPSPSVFPPEVLEQLRQQYLEQAALTDVAPEAPAYELVEAEEPDEEDFEDTSGPVARLPTLEDLPKPAWHTSSAAMPREMFARLLRVLPDLRKLPKHVLRGIAGKGPRAHDTSGVDPVMRQYVMLPGETFAGIARNLTGDPDRAVELLAANPNHDPARMRVNIPPGWLEFTPLLLADSAEDTGMIRGKPPAKTEQPKETPKPNLSANAQQQPKKSQLTAQKAKDGPRPNLTKRLIEVLSNDWPEKIADRVGAKKTDARWWKTLKEANPHKAVAPSGNWQTLFAGEILNYPDTWPAHLQAVPAPGVPADPVQPPAPSTPPATPPAPQPGPAPSTPGGTSPAPIPSGATADFATTSHAQTVLALWAAKNPHIARPSDFGRTLIPDVTGSMTERTRSCLSTFQLWWNEQAKSTVLRTDGVLDPASYEALKQYSIDALKDVPGLPPLPGASPAPSPGGGGSPAPGSPTPGGGLPIPGSTAPKTPPPAPTPTQPAQPQPAPAAKDDDAAVLVVGGTILSLLFH